MYRMIDLSELPQLRDHSEYFLSIFLLWKLIIFLTASLRGANLIIRENLEKEASTWSFMQFSWALSKHLFIYICILIEKASFFDTNENVYLNNELTKLW